jgi:hypothetical protein
MTSGGTIAPQTPERHPGSNSIRREEGPSSPADGNHPPRKPARIEIGEAAARRHTAPIASMLLWGVLCACAVVALHILTAGWGMRQGSYRTGILTLSVFVLAALYPLRKYTIWVSLHWLRLASRLPRAWAVRLLLLDRLETWRVVHITFGVFAMLPFWWHIQFGRRSLLELGLEILVILLVFSGFLGALIEDFLPVRMLQSGNQEVRLQDVEAASHQLYVEAEELVLGHSETLVRAYLAFIRPILIGSQPDRTLLWATLTGSNPAPAACKPVRLRAAGFGAEAAVFHELVSIAERKVGLDHNLFNLKLGRAWLRLHRRLALSVLLLIIFHVAGVLYFAGI